jgi:lipid II:glycine glycyltransferase (peptidoglycan interpeptide bridge formation enzyme)
VIATIDLTQDTEKIDAAIRKSYRSLINWGKKNLSLEYVNADAPSRDKFLEYQEFHKLIAGRVTRTQESWDAMYKVLENGSGELILGYESGALVSGALIIDGAKVSIYASGAYDRSKFDRPLAHWPLYDGILRAKKRGMRNFELGSVDKASNPSQKEAQIALFKRGFASHLVPTLSWVIPIQKK